MKAVIKKTELDTLLADSENALRNYLYINGKKYPTDQWVTVAEYCNRFNIPNTQTLKQRENPQSFRFGDLNNWNVEIILKLVEVLQLDKPSLADPSNT